MPVEETYRGLLREAVSRAGGQDAAARLAGLDQATISRTLKSGSRATYTTLIKLSRTLSELPTPVVAVRDMAHEEWCKLGAELQKLRPMLFSMLMDAARESLPAPEISDDAIDRLRKTVAAPTVSQTIAKSSQRTPKRRG